MEATTHIKKPNGAIALVNDIIEQAVKLRASDIHLEPRSDALKVRYRVDGLLHDGISIHKSMQASVISRIKVMVNLDIAEWRLPQDGRVFLKISDKEIDFRVSTIPTVHGEKIVMRLLERKAVLIGLSELGMTKEDFALFKSLVSKPHGMILVSGPTGAGKTTTLYAALNYINTDSQNIMTIEDPVEYQLPNINQIHVNYKAGLTFARGLRSILRQDPDVIMVGEIRDEETARIAIQSALTGHLVLSTVHANDSASTIVRLMDMGIEPYLIKATLIGAVAQRLVRTYCKKCRGETKCKDCNFTGFSGRTGVYEILKISEEIKKLIKKDVHAVEVRKEANAVGMKTLSQNGELLLANKVTSKEELIRSIYLDS